MVITLKINATPENLSVTAPQADLSLHARSVIAYDTERQNICAVGQTAGELQETFPIEWEKRKAFLEFSCPVDVKRFSPALATVAIQYYAMMTYVETRPLYKRWLTELYDSFDLDLRLQDYEQLSDTQRHEFETMVLWNSIVKIHQLLINERPPTVEGGTLEERLRDARTRWLAVIVFLNAVVIWVLGLMGGAWLLFETITPPAILSKSMGWSDMLVGLFAAAVVSSVLVYTGWVLGGITLALIGQHFVPPSNLRHFLLSPKVGMPKSIMARLLNRLQHTSLGGG